jgi:DNA-binding CsgD family transcriptional regulator/hemerythrin
MPVIIHTLIFQTVNKAGQMAEVSMKTHHTGHAEIDQQHAILERMVGQLSAFCSEVGQDPNAVCDKCSSIKQKHCTSSLTSLTSELAAFLIGHATYEERMMELLPDTPSCQAHIKAHKAAHEGISKQLRKLSVQIINQSPRVASSHVWRVIGDWLGEHLASFDSHLVGLGKSDAPEIDFDEELVAMLDQHVFPNRPTMAKNPSDTDLTLQRKKLEVRGRFESLSTMQRTVFWLVVSGKKNREIAEALGVTVNTIKTHRASIFQKMEVRSVVELVKKADILR